MPELTLEISEAAKQRLDLVVADYNATNSTALTLEEWLDLHVREVAVQREFAARAEQLKRQSEEDLSAAINAERDRLLSQVAIGGGA